MKKNKSKVISEMYLQLFPAQYLSFVASSLSGIINGIIVGNYLSAESMVALGFVSPLLQFFTAISAVIAGGSRIICGRLLGRNENHKIKNVFSESILALLVVGTVITIALLVFAPQFASLLGAKDSSIALTVLYLRGLAIGVIPTLLVPNFMAFLQLTNENNTSFVSVIILVATNLLCSLLNVTVINGGVLGMGISTSLAQTASLLFMIIFIKKKKEELKFNRKFVDRKEILDIVKLGSPNALANLLYATRNVIYNGQALVLAGEDAVSALAIMTNSEGIFVGLNCSQGAVGLVLSSVFVGEKDKNSVKNMFKTLFVYSLFMAAFTIFFLTVLGGFYVSLFGAKGNVLALSRELYFAYSLALSLNVILQTSYSIYQSLGRVKYVNVLYVVNAMAVPMLCCFVLAPAVGIKGLWYSYFIAEVVPLTIMLSYPAIKNRKFPKSFDDFFEFDKSFDLANKLSFTVYELNEVVEVSKRVGEFCKKYNIDNKRTMMSSLCIEEIAGNVVEHGFTKSKRTDMSIEIFVSYYNDEVNIRIRDDAPSFDPRTRLGTYNPEDPTKNMGIRLVNSVAKEMSYQSYFGMNVLSIKL